MDAHRDVVNDPRPTDARQCAWCKRYYDTKTKEYIPEPKPGLLGGHGICLECYGEMKMEFERTKGKK